MKVIIEDLVAKHSGKKEKELPENTQIRFEFDENTHISVQIKDDYLYIYKVGNTSKPFEIHPIMSNVIHVK